MSRVVTDPPEKTAKADGSVPGGWWSDGSDGRILCQLCPRACRLKEGDRGFCFVRENRDGQMVLTTYGRSTGFCVDPIEKKPLNHFYPGTSVLSFGTAGCNLGCKFCQNWDISKSREIARLSNRALPDDIAEAAFQLGCKSVAFTYNDPVIWAEYAIDSARACRNRDIQSVAVTAGYITPEARGSFFHEMDAANVDLKAFSEEFYYQVTLSHLQPVLDTLQWLKQESDVWFEITNLIIPQSNDSDDEFRRMIDWILNHIGDEVPMHFTAFHPDFRMTDRDKTPHDTLLRAYDAATKAGLKFVYVGNVNDVARQSTYCPECRGLLIERNWHQLGQYALNENQCAHCNTSIAGRFQTSPGTWGRKRLPIQISDYIHQPASQLPILGDAPRPKQGTPKMVTQPKADRPHLSKQQESVLHRTACELIAAAVNGFPTTLPDDILAGTADLPVAGIFVTAKRAGRLRGCCGSLGKPVRLIDSLVTSATRTAVDDPRMPPISPRELPFLHLDVYLLFGLQPVRSSGTSRVKDIEIGRHGLRIQRDNQAGLLLPSVAVEHQLDSEAFLRMVCRKAGLPSTAWQDDRSQLLTFEGYAIEADFDKDVLQRFPIEKTPPLTIEELGHLNTACTQNVVALAQGAVPNYYISGVSDATVAGVAMEVQVSGYEQPIQSINYSLRPGVPMQSTLFSMCQATVESIKSSSKPDQVLNPASVSVTILYDPAMNGTLAAPDMQGVDPNSHALLAIEGSKYFLLKNPDLTCDQLAKAVESAIQPTDPEYVGLYSLTTRSADSHVNVHNVPQPKQGVLQRPPAVAGTFYPDNADELNRLVDDMLGSDEQPTERWRAAMVPHAGLRFSGHIAGNTLRRIEIPETVIVIGPKHTRDGVDWAVAPHQTWRIPGATVENDRELAHELVSQIPRLQLDAAAHQREHAIEMELPFLSRLAPHSRVVGIVIGGGTFEHCMAFADGLANVLQSWPEMPLLIISSDMNHYASDSENRRLDKMALDAMMGLNPKELFTTVHQHNISMCGMLPAIIVMQTLCKMGGLKTCQQTKYGTSAEVSGDLDRVVGYAGMLLN